MSERDTVGDWLRELRTRRGISQRALAKTLGVSHITIVRWETHKTYPTPIFRKVLSTLGRDVGLGPIPPPENPSKRWSTEDDDA